MTNLKPATSPTHFFLYQLILNFFFLAGIKNRIQMFHCNHKQTDTYCTTNFIFSISKIPKCYGEISGSSNIGSDIAFEINQNPHLHFTFTFLADAFIWFVQPPCSNWFAAGKFFCPQFQMYSPELTYMVR